jgi:hypothetical protein
LSRGPGPDDDKIEFFHAQELGSEDSDSKSRSGFEITTRIQNHACQ